MTALQSFMMPRAEGLSMALAEKLVMKRLSAITRGQLELEHEGRRRVFGSADHDGLSARVRVHDRRLFVSLVKNGSIGAGEAFMAGFWSSDDLTSTLRIFARNADALSGLDKGPSRLGLALERLRHLARRNTLDGSRRNISEHYDLGNDFFARMLDPTMTYSAGVFDSKESTLQEASERKLDLLCRKLELRPTDHLLEIGTGWGSMAIWAARNYGCRVTTTTISREQHALATRRIAEAGLADRVTVLLSDYRHLEGPFASGAADRRDVLHPAGGHARPMTRGFDKLVSVEMIEAVGREYLPDFFGRCAQLVVPGGKVAIQAITIRDQLFEEAAKEVDFIKRHIFPGSCIPSPTALLEAATKGSDLRLKAFDDYAPHYARTLLEWRKNLAPHRAEVVEQYGEKFWRMWTYYLCLCEAGFAEDYIGVGQFVFVR